MKSIFFCFIFSSTLYAQTGSEIFLYKVNRKDNVITFSDPVNITNHPGYDNQPMLDEKGNVYYSSFNPDGRSDIRVYDIKKRISNNFTNTPEREYSPTLTPDKKFISCIIQSDNEAQDLGMYPIKGGKPQILINDLTVGYHAWVDSDRVILFVLGEPNSLQLYNVKTKERKILTQNIGRSLHKIPGQNAMSFVQKNSTENWQIMKWDIATEKISVFAPALPSREDLTWTPVGELIMSDGQKLFGWKENKWSEIPVPDSESIKGITRLAFSPKGDFIAIVVTE